ncbi:MAG: hypothetical protein AAF468_12445 [Pseudomonadota bacterium]
MNDFIDIRAEITGEINTIFDHHPRGGEMAALHDLWLRCDGEEQEAFAQIMISIVVSMRARSGQ